MDIYRSEAGLARTAYIGKALRPMPPTWGDSEVGVHKIEGRRRLAEKGGHRGFEVLFSYRNIIVGIETERLF